ncbi:hypothetical protein ACNQKP_09355 [Bdellovibrio bacteriovorus]|uniref:hypothetical protein n=1 Tax=Bdellovibrio bacteriovorus TaxID=959 RepID=UPI003AA8FC69
MFRNSNKALCGIAILFVQLIFGSVAFAEETDELILEVVAQGGARLGEPLVALQTSSQVLLPLEDAAKVLGVRVEHPEAKNYRVYTSIDAYEEINLNKCSDSAAPVFCGGHTQVRGVLYLPAAYLTDVLKWPLSVDEANMRLVVSRASNELGKESFRHQSALRPMVIQRDLLGYPTFRVEAEYVGPQDVFGGSLYSMQSLLGHDSEMQYSRFDQSEVFHWSLSKELFPEDEKSLAPKNYSMGSVQTYDLKYIATPVNVTGARISNRRIDSNLFDTQNVFEKGPPRWKVELFINGTYFGETIVAADGIFSFEGVPIFYGNNTLIYRFTSPIGQTYEFSKDYNVLNEFEGRGRWAYQLSYGQVENSALYMGSAQVGYGLSSNLNLSAGFAEAPLEKERRHYSQYGLTWMQEFYSLGVQSMEDMSTHGTALAFTPKVNWKGFLLTSEYASFKDFRSQQVNKITGSSQTSSWETSMMKRLDLGIPVVTQVAVDKDEFETTGTSTDLKLRTYSMLGTKSLLMEAEKRWHSVDSSELYLEYGDYNRALRGKYGVFFFDGGGMKGRVSLEKNWTPVFYTTAGADFIDRWNRNSYNFGASHLFSQVLLEARVSTFASETVYSLSVSTNFRATPAGLELNSLESFQMGRIRVVAFIDENGDGKKDSNETTLRGLRILHAQRQKEYETNDAGEVIIKSVAPYQRMTLEVVRESVTNIYLTPSDLGHDVAVTPGQELVLYIPVGPSFDVRGSVENPHFKKLVPMELCSPEGTVVATTLTSAAGKYRFDDVKAGQYLVRINDQFLKENKLSLQAQGTAKVAGKPGVILVDPVVVTVLDKN